MAYSTEKMREDLIERKYDPSLIANETTELVLEGYPRSGNTFAWDMINILCDGKLRMSHHVHEYKNVAIGQSKGAPVVILIRNPMDAILSFSIYSDNPIPFCARQYFDFYEGVLKYNDGFCFVAFDQVINDFNGVIRKINAETGVSIPEADNLEAVAKEARARAKARSVKTHGEKALQRVGTPTAEREEMKYLKRSEVRDHLAERPDINDVYQRVMALV